MKISRHLALFIVLAISFSTVLSSFPVSSAAESSLDFVGSDVPESHVIDGVPYVTNTEIRFCYYASMTMVFQYYGIDTSKDEVVFNTGAGYSLYYPNSSEDHLPYEGQMIVSGDIVASVYGLSWETWYKNKTGDSNDEGWFEYLNRVKENISNNIPVLTFVDPHKLPTIPAQTGLFGYFYKRRPPSAHIIVLVGYNDTNGTICFHDSNAGIYGDPSYGTYCWMDVDEFKEAVQAAAKPYYSVEIYKDLIGVDPLPKKEAFEKVHKINIEKLKGNISAYCEWYDSALSMNQSEEHQVGINASIAFKKDLEPGLNNRIKTIHLYKLKGKLGFKYSLHDGLYHLASILFPEGSKVPLLNPETDAVFHWILEDITHTADYLRNNTDLSEICSYDANLIDQCAENWSYLLDCYSVFMKRGVFLSLPRALVLMDKMADAMDNIISIQQAIIDGPV